jgi:hypothetical protein
VELITAADHLFEAARALSRAADAMAATAPEKAPARDFHTLEEIAGWEGVKPATVRAWCREGKNVAGTLVKLGGFNAGSGYQVPRDAYRRFREEVRAAAEAPAAAIGGEGYLAALRG